MVTLIEEMRCAHKRSATRITHELPLDAILISRRTVTRHLAVLGLNGRKFLGPTAQPTVSCRRSLLDGPATWCTAT